jgi:hypothetical protein
LFDKGDSQIDQISQTDLRAADGLDFFLHLPR